MAVTKLGRSIASQVIATDTDTAGQPFSVDASTKNMILVCKVSSRTDGTFTPRVEHSHDGSNWETLKAGAAISTNDTTYTAFEESNDGPCLGLIRIVVTSASTTSGATVEAELRYD